MAAKKKTAGKSKKRASAQAPSVNVGNDLAAVTLLALAILTALSLYSPDATGVFGAFISYVAAALFGVGRFVIPPALLVTALVYLFDRTEEARVPAVALSLCGIATLAFFVVREPSRTYFAIDLMKRTGGLVGSLCAYPLETLFGTAGAYVILATVFVSGLILAANKPVRSLISPREAAPRAPRAVRTVLRPELTKPIAFDSETPQADAPSAAAPTVVLETEEAPAGETSVQSAVEHAALPAGSEPYELPKLEYLSRSKGKLAKTATEFKPVLEATLRDFNVPAEVVDIQEGPTVTTFELRLEPGTRVNRLLSLEHEIALALATPNIRILAPIPGKQAIGIEVPNIVRELVTLGDLLATPQWKESTDPLLIAVGKDISGQPFFFSLREMPHLLIAGATGSGKSVALNSLIVSILYRATPEQVKFVLVDPKRVELTPYNGLPHLMAPVITNPRQASSALQYVVGEMERRYDLLSSVAVRNIASFNQKATESGLEPIPYIVVVIDELADLMMVAAGEVEDAIVRIAQLARAVGIHLVVATQRPSADVITGLIRSNITTRMAFSVGTQVDSRVILDTPGAERLIGRGDMLFITQSLLRPIRLQAPFVSEAEVEKVTSFIKKQRAPLYNEDILKFDRAKSMEGELEDELFEEAVETILASGQASVSYLQRKLRIGYARAARLMDMLEERGIVSEQDGARPREILITPEEWEQLREKL
jgi:S-DNA-T family DNA segregation ATPase FtsK/SpoIIIE